MEYIARLIAMDPADVTLNAALLGGVSAMPSLHIAMVGLTAYWLGVGNRKTMFFAVPWVLTVWASTVMLGWHYALDGAGGLVLAAGAIAATSWLVKRWPSMLGAKASSLAAPMTARQTTPRSPLNG
jgi:membrane-associated phospholipid phosphatase